MRAPNGTPWTVRRRWVPDDRVNFAPRGLIHIVPPLLLWNLLLLIWAVGKHFLLDRPWVIEARSLDKTKRYEIVGWRASRKAIAFIARSLRASVVPPAYVPGDVSRYG